MQIVKRITWEDAYDIVVPQINAEGLLTWDFDSSLPVQVRFYTYDRRRDYRLCRHDYFEIFYLHSGELLFQVADKTYPMKKGDLILLNSAQYHTVHPPERKSRHHAVHGVLLYFMPEAVRGAGSAGEDMEYLIPFLHQDAGFPHVVPAETRLPLAVFELMQMIAAELPSRTARARLSVKTYLKMALIRLANHYASYRGSEDSFQRKQKLIERLRPLFQYLDERYSEPITLDDAARIVGMSKSHFIHFMKQVTGLSFVSYLNQFRVARAQTLLATTDQSIAEISQEVGFCDQSYFGHVFRKLLKMSPREYRVQLEVNASSFYKKN